MWIQACGVVEEMNMRVVEDRVGVEESGGGWMDMWVYGV